MKKNENKANLAHKLGGDVVKVRSEGKVRKTPAKLPQNPTWLKQPNVVTLMSSNFKTLQVRILIALIERIQQSIDERINKIPESQLSLFKDANDNGKVKVDIKYQDLGITTSQYCYIKPALKQLSSIPVEVDAIDPISGADSWLLTGLMKAYVPKSHSRFFTVELDKEVARIFVNVDKGFTRFIKEIAFSTQSKYTVRMYMLISSWKEKGGFSISLPRFRKWLSIEKKYSQYKDLYKRVIKPVYNELFQKADCWFEVAEVYQEGSSVPHKLNFKVVRANLTKAEQETLELHTKNIMNLCFTYLKMDDKHLKQIKPLITLSNFAQITQKVTFLIGYCDKHWRDISSIPEYCTQAIQNEFEIVPVDLENQLFIK